jgi:hypothetical protein
VKGSLGFNHRYANCLVGVDCLARLRFLEVPSSTLAIEQHRSMDGDCTVTKVHMLDFQLDGWNRQGAISEAQLIKWKSADNEASDR